MKKEHTLYAFITDVKDWKEGQRKTFIIHSAKSTAKTSVGVLGQNSKIIEYKSDDVSSRFRQTADGLEVSVVKAQRIYDDHRWPNPVVIKLENVDPVIDEAVQVMTAGNQASPQAGILTGKIVAFKPGSAQKACFYYRPYIGQVETVYASAWVQTAWTNIKPNGGFEVALKDFKKGQQYEYKAVALQYGLQVEGENQIFRGIK